MRRVIYMALILLAVEHDSMAQTRIYFSVGSNQVTEYFTEPNFNLGFNNNAITVGGYYDSRSFGKYNTFDIQVQKRLFGSLYLVSGGSFFQSGYSWGGDYFSSELKNTYIGIPFLLRFNFYNANVYYFDGGFIGNYLLKANLVETYGQNRATGDISQYLSRFSSSYLMQFNVVINRVVFSIYSIIKVSGTASDFSDNWELPRNQSVFLIYWREYYFKASGVKISYRLR